MSTIKSSNEHLTFNADGSAKEIRFQANGTQKASISSAGLFTSTTIDATALTGNLPAISGASLTNLPADSTKLPLAGGTLTGDVNMLKTSGNSELKVEASGTDAYATVRLKNDAKDYSMQIRSDQSDAWTVRDETAGANRLLIDTSGNVLIGRTSVGATGNGHSIRGADSAIFSRNATGETMQICRNAADGELIRFKSNDVIKGLIFTSHATYLGLGTNTTGLLFNSATRGVLPANPANASSGAQLDATLDLGHASVKWKDLYLSGGIQFDARSNKLDDYEEGNFTPVFTGTSGSAGSFNTGEWEGRYTKIGRLVTCIWKTTLTDRGSWAGEVRFTGLPFTPNWTVPGAGSVGLRKVNYAGGSVGSVNTYVTNGQTYWGVVYSQDNDVHSWVQVTDCHDDAGFWGVITYVTA